MPLPRSKDAPFLAGGMEIVNGEAVIDTGFVTLQSFTTSFMISNFVTDQEAKLSWYELPTYRYPTIHVVIRAEKGGANEGLLGDNDVSVSWLAIGA